jgi:hypothetical protein
LYLQNISKRRNARSPYQWILEIYWSTSWTPERQ